MSKEKLIDVMEKRKVQRNLIRGTVLGILLIILLAIGIGTYSTLNAPEPIEKRFSEDLAKLGNELGQDKYYEIMGDFHQVYSLSTCFSDLTDYNIDFENYIVRIYYPNNFHMVLTSEKHDYYLNDKEIGIEAWCEAKGHPF